MKEQNAYNLLYDLMEKIDAFMEEHARPPQHVKVNASIWRDALDKHGAPRILHISRVVCGQTVWPVSNVEYIVVK